MLSLKHNVDKSAVLNASVCMQMSRQNVSMAKELGKTDRTERTSMSEGGVCARARARARVCVCVCVCVCVVWVYALWGRRNASGGEGKDVCARMCVCVTDPVVD